MTNNVAEYHGAIAALHWVAENSAAGTSVIAQGIRNLVINQVNGVWRVKYNIKAMCAGAARASRTSQLPICLDS